MSTSFNKIKKVPTHNIMIVRGTLTIDETHVFGAITTFYRSHLFIRPN